MRSPFDTQIVIFNRRLNPETGLDQWHPTLIERVQWHSRQLAKWENSGMGESQKVQIRILASSQSNKCFVPPAAYTLPESQYTLQTGDVVVRYKNAAELFLPQGWVDTPPEDSGEFCTITLWRDNRPGLLGHLVLEGI